MENQIKEIELKWEGPFEWFSKSNPADSIFRNPKFEGKPGIYLWTYTFENTFYVYYVGQSLYLNDRLREEITKTLNSIYFIADFDDKNDCEINFAYKPDDGLSDFLAKYETLSKKAFKVITETKIFIAVVKDNDKINLSSIESSIIKTLKETYEKNKKDILTNLGISKRPYGDLMIRFLWSDKSKIPFGMSDKKFADEGIIY